VGGRASGEKRDCSLKTALAFDRSIRQTAERMAGTDTLILFTADHSYELRIYDGKKGQPLLTDADKATPSDVLDLGEGSGAERVRGFLANTDLFRIMMAAYGWQPWTEAHRSGSATAEGK
jgi:alkaline phosphatase